MSSLSRNWVYFIAIAVLILASITVAYHLNQTQMVFWSGVAVTVGGGSFTAILLSLFVIEPLSKRKRDREWRTVRKNAIHAIAVHLVDFATLAYRKFPYLENHSSMDKIVSGQDQPSKEAVEGFKMLGAQFRKYQDAKMKDRDDEDYKTPSRWAIQYYDDPEVRYNLDSIRDVWLPRIIQSCNNQDLIDRLIEFDKARADLHYSKLVYEDMMSTKVSSDMGNLMDKAGDLYEELRKEWEDIE